MDNPGWSTDEEFAAAPGRRARRQELAGHVAAWTAALSPDEVTERCQAEGVPAGPMRHPTELLADPQLISRGFLVAIDQPDIGPLVLDGRSFTATDLAEPIETPAPRLGQHTLEICHERRGLDDAEIDRLIAAGVLEV
jgi:crotonobetainyl-CoA:carnitine CoA-transferase CaiB-like acyl-CoA transferase